MGQEQVYSGSKWAAVRMQRLHEPVDGFEHLAHQAVVEFPNAADATAFYAASIRTWRACAPGRYTYSPGDGQDDAVWLVGQMNDQNRTLTTSKTQQEGDGWTCQ